MPLLTPLLVADHYPIATTNVERQAYMPSPHYNITDESVGSSVPMTMMLTGTTMPHEDKNGARTMPACR
jgi:hypothetical protein